MKELFYIVICFVLIQFSCTKTARDVHFHGRVTVGCNGQIPVKNCQVVISREYDTGTHQYQTIGQTVTDENGYYEFIVDVRQRRNFMYYVYSFYTSVIPEISSSPQFWGYEECHVEGKNLEVNCNAMGCLAYKFHIKNVAPFNSADELNSIAVSQLDNNNLPTHGLTHISNLTGNVDTVIYQFYSDRTRKLGFEYSYTKNGILTSVPIDTMVLPLCLDTTTVNIFY